MHSFRAVRRVLIVASIVLGAATAAAAQDLPRADVAVSYSILHDTDVDETFKWGWVGAATVHATDWLAIVGEVGGNYRTFEAFDVELDLSVHSFMGGARFGAPLGSVTPFGQILFGQARASASILGESESESAFAFQPGAGLDIALGRRAALRVQGDYRSISSDGETSGQIRFAVGVAFGFGSR